jgi:hypothetical protein
LGPKTRNQTVKFGLRGECILRAEILAEFLEIRAFSRMLQNLHIFYKLMIYFVSYVLGLAKRGRENSENAISDDLYQ